MFRFFFLLTPIFPSAQISMLNLSLTDSSMNIVYIGVDNTIELNGYKNQDQLSYSITNGTLRDIGQNRYTLNPLKEGGCIVIFREKEKIIIQKTFNVSAIPAPIVKFSSRYDSIDRNGSFYFKLNNLINDPVLRIEVPNFYFRRTWNILNYRITLDNEVSKEAIITEFVVEGGELTKEQIQKIRSYGTNTFMTIEDIRVTDPNGRIRKLTPFIIHIK